jgi:hypothetical protein
VHITGMSERSTGLDERLAAIFKDMRRGLNIPIDKLALALKTTPHVIQLLETGQVHAFPPWPETVRIVTELGKLYRVDTRPILNRIRDQVGPAGLEQVPIAPQAPTISPKEIAASLDSRHPLVRAMSRRRRKKGLSADPAADRRVKRRTRRAARTMFALSAPIALLGALVWLAQAQPSLIMRAVSALPGPVAQAVRPAANALIVHLAPWRDGMRWIEVGDPRLRKSDKLRQASR